MINVDIQFGYIFTFIYDQFRDKLWIHFRIHSVFILVFLLQPFWNPFISILNHLDPIWNPLGSILDMHLDSFWIHFGYILDSIWIHYGVRSGCIFESIYVRQHCTVDMVEGSLGKLDKVGEGTRIGAKIYTCIRTHKLCIHMYA